MNKFKITTTYGEFEIEALNHTDARTTAEAIAKGEILSITKKAKESNQSEFPLEL